MHEYALADAVLRAVVRVAGEEGLRLVTRVAVRVGELQQIDPETFRFALEQARPADDPRLAAARVEVEVTPARFACRGCGRSFGLGEAGARDADAGEAIHFVPELAHAFLRCPSCGGPDFDLAEGRGVEIAAIEGERGDA